MPVNDNVLQEQSHDVCLFVVSSLTMYLSLRNGALMRFQFNVNFHSIECERRQVQKRTLVQQRLCHHVFMPRHKKVAGYYVIPSELLSVFQSV